MSDKVNDVINFILQPHEMGETGVKLPKIE